MDVARSIRFVFQDAHWLKKVLIGGGLSLVPILGWFIVSGYYLRTVQHVTRDVNTALPDWDDFGGDLVRGMKLTLVSAAYLSPLLLIVIVAFALLLVGEHGLGTVALIGYNLIALPYTLALYFLTPVFVGRLAEEERITAAFQFGAMVEEVKRVWTHLLIFAAASYAISAVAGIGVILCLVGVFFTAFVGVIISAHLVGQIRQLLGSTVLGDVDVAGDQLA